MKPNNHIINNKYAFSQKKILNNLLLFPLIIFLILFLLSASSFCEASEIELIENSYGENKPMTPKILVAYATRAGSTAEVADAIGKKLAAGGAMVDVKPIKKVQSIDGYQGVVLGSAIRRGAVLPEVTDFVKSHKDELGKIPVAYFIVCMILREDTEESRKKAASYLDSLRAEANAVDTGMFAGKLDYSKLNFVDAFVVEHIIGTPEGDLRDWKQINTWAINLLPKLINIKKEK
jgi:menaquinone-dependent protoporphyrinogen oxidase